MVAVDQIFPICYNMGITFVGVIMKRSTVAVAISLALGTAAHAQTPTKVPSTDPKFYETVEATTTRAVTIVNAQFAYSRGWTGLGSTVLIMDTGINEAHLDFAGKIKYKRNFTVRTPDENVRDEQGHGTHVAGIVAAAKNNLIVSGRGSHGIAYDANLAVAKIATKTNFNMGLANAAMAWASQYSDVVVANLSANVNYNAAYTAASQQVAPGLFINTHQHYGGARYYNLETPYAYKIPENMVLTVSAGNTNLGYVQSPAVFAAATDAQGNLVHGGRMLVVGNWNAGLKVIEGAKSGHMCKDYRNNQCYDLYRTSDFYILAPGAGVYSTAFNNNNSTRAMSGTSQAAPVVAGAIAIINQMWPYMTPANQVQLLLKTANKDLPGYSVNTHGQGLLDLDRATRPFGNVGVSTTGRTGVVKPIEGIAITGGAAQIGGGSTIVVDSFGRDFRMDLAPTVRENRISANLLSYMPGQRWSTRVAGVAMQERSGLAVGINNTNSAISVNDQRHRVTLARANYNPHAQFSGMWGDVMGTSIIEYDYTLRGNNGTWAQVGFMNTTTDLHPGIINRISDVQSAYLTAGYQYQNIGFYAGVQPTVIGGHVDLKMPSMVDEQGVMSYTHSRVSMIERTAVGYAGMNWAQPIDSQSRVLFNVSANSVGDYRTSVNYTKSF